MPIPDMPVLMASPLTLRVIHMYRTYTRLNGLGPRRRDPGAKLVWMIAFAGVLHPAW